MKQYDQQLNHSTDRMKEWLNTSLFDLQSRLGRITNLLIMFIITASVMISMFGTVGSLSDGLKQSIHLFEIAITIFFAIEYLLRIYSAHNRPGYIFGIYGVLDLLTWLPLLLFGQVSIAVRLLRVLRLLKLIRYLKAMRLFFASMADIVDLIFVVLASICIIVLVSGNLIYYIEPETFPNAFIGCWWSLVTMTTVGYGDLIPQSIAGKIEAGVLMLTGITMFAILTGTVSIKLSEHLKGKSICPHCHKNTLIGAHYCHLCGEKQETHK